MSGRQLTACLTPRPGEGVSSADARVPTTPREGPALNRPRVWKGPASVSERPEVPAAPTGSQTSGFEAIFMDPTHLASWSWAPRTGDAPRLRLKGQQEPRPSHHPCPATPERARSLLEPHRRPCQGPWCPKPVAAGDEDLAGTREGHGPVDRDGRQFSEERRQWNLWARSPGATQETRLPPW